MIAPVLDTTNKSLENATQTLVKGLLVLEAVSRDKTGKGVRLVDICRQLDIHKSTAHRLLGTLEALGYLEQSNENDRYRLGLKVLSLSASLMASLEVRSQAFPLLNELMLRVKHAVHLVILDIQKGEAVYIDKVDSPQPVRMYTYVGIRFPANCTASGKAIMAYISEEKLGPILSNLQSRTVNSVVTPDAMRHELEQIRAKGYALDDEENAIGIRCVAAPIFDHTRSVIASVCISAASAYLAPQEMPNIAPDVVETAQRISERMGYRL